MQFNFHKFQIPGPRLIAVGVVVLFAAGFLVYFFNSVRLPVETASSCDRNSAGFSKLRRFAKGKMASFQPAVPPVKLSAISFDDENGSVVSLAKWQGRTVLFNLWATWCGPCRKEMPALDRLQKELGGADFEVVPVSVDRGSNAKSKAFYKQFNLTSLPFYTDGTTRIFAKLGEMGLVFGLPTTILIDKNGCALGTLKGRAEWDSDDTKELIRAMM